jgi:glycosyltransferase involved in cell wall biosynthesis
MWTFSPGYLMDKTVNNPILGVVAPRFVGFNETFIYRQVMGFQRWTPHIFAEELCHQDLFPFPSELVEVLPSIRREAVPRFRRQVDHLWHGIRRGNYLGWSGHKADVLRNHLQTVQPQVLLAHYGYVGLGISKIAKDLGIPLVVHFHGGDATGYLSNRWYRKSICSLAADASRLIVVSREMEKALSEVGIPNSAMIRIPYGVDLPDLNEVDRDREEVTFLAVARLIEVKGPLHTLEAFRKVHSQHPSTRLIYLGDGDMRKELEATIRSHGLQEVVQLLGSVPNDFVQESMSRADIFLQHSKPTREGAIEGTPVALLEAASWALPIVSTLQGGIKDIVVPGETGYLVEVEDEDKMAHHMARLVEDRTLRQEMGAAGRRRIENHFSLNREIEQLETLFNDSTAPRRG